MSWGDGYPLFYHREHPQKKHTEEDQCKERHRPYKLHERKILGSTSHLPMGKMLLSVSITFHKR
jgi:hypothetical protein